MRVRSELAGLALVGLAFTNHARGEVAAKIGSDGSYLCMSYGYTIVNGTVRIWSVPSTSALPVSEDDPVSDVHLIAPATVKKLASDRPAQSTYLVPLNPTGDAIGDLAPTVLEAGLANNWPVVVWAHPGGGDFDLVYSAWTGGGWATILPVAPDDSFNDLEPRLASSSVGDVYLVWWKNEKGVGAAYFSVLTSSGWTTPTRVSRTGIDSRHPNLVVVSDELVHVSYDTPPGTEVREVRIQRLAGITDDIDPKRKVEITVSP